MAQVTFNGPIESIRGQLGQQSGIYFMTRNGKTYMCRKSKKKTPQPESDEPTVSKEMLSKMEHTAVLSKMEHTAVLSKMERSRKRFAIAQKIATEIDKTTYLRAQFAKKWNTRQYSTLKGYIFNFVYHHDQLSIDV